MKRMERVCPDTDVLAAWVEGGLPPPERGALKAHLAACDDCRRSAALAATLEATEAEAAVDELFVRRLVAASRRRPRWPWAVAAAALLALGTAILAGRPDPAPPAPPPAPALAKEQPPPLPPPPPAPPPPAPDAAPVEAPQPPPPPPPAPEPKPLIARAVPVPVPAPPSPAPAPEPPKPPPASDVAKPVPPPPTETDLALVFTPVFAGDPAGDLWLRRDGAEDAQAGAFERVAFRDVFSARADAAAFTLDARASVVLERGAEAAVSWFKADGAFRLDLLRGSVFVDTEGAAQRWLFTAGPARVAFAELSGRISVETRDDVLSVHLLEGKAVVEAGGARRDVEPGREVVLDAAGKLGVRKAGPAGEKLARLLKIRPRTSTAFAAGFEERKDGVDPFPYTVIMGRVVSTTAGAFLEAASPATGLSAALKPARPIEATDGMILRFRYRTNLPSFFVKVSEPAPDGKERVYVGAVESRSRIAAWTDTELLLAGLSDEGVPVVPSTAIQEIRFQGVPTGGKSGLLEVDSVQFLRRAR